MIVDRALEIIASHGADARRWPADERAAVQALAADARVAAALADARGLDALLTGWAGAEVPLAIDIAAITRQPQVQPRPPLRGRAWIAGGALAAAVAATIALVPMRDMPQATSTTNIAAISHSPVRSATAERGLSSSDADAFGYVFTPTADEDQLI